VQSGLLLDVVVRKGAAVLKLLACEDEALLVRGDAFLVLDLRLDVVDGVGCFNIKSDGLPRKGLHEDLHAAPEAQDEVQSGLLLDVVVRKGAAVLKLLACEDEALLVRGDAFLVLDLRLDVVDGVGGLDVQSDGLPSQGLHKDLHTSPEAQDKVESGLLLNVVI